MCVTAAGFFIHVHEDDEICNEFLIEKVFFSFALRKVYLIRARDIPGFDLDQKLPLWIICIHDNVATGEVSS